MIICGTGHRPQDLPCLFEKHHPWKIAKLKLLNKVLKELKPEKVISGMAIGFDMWLAHTSIKLGIPTVAYCPFKGQESRWNPEFKQQYTSLLSDCSAVKFISEGNYAGWKMHRRNEAMIDDSDQVITLWNPKKKYGGTWSTVAYAISKQKPPINIWPETPELVKIY